MCGIVGIYSSDVVAPNIYTCLRAIQHRGQESAGIATYDTNIKCVKGMGLVHEIFDNDKICSLTGSIGIGHVRYSTTGMSKIENAQPVTVTTSVGDIALAHNGDIVNAGLLREELQRQGWAFITDTDSEIIVRLLANEIISVNDLVRALKEVMKKIIGSYSIVILIKNKLLAVRDKFGIRPLCIGKYKKDYIISSESAALDAIDAEFIRDINPGEIIEIDKEGLRSHRAYSEKYPAHCMFEYVYFARSDSVIDGKCVYDVRMNIGKKLAKEHPAKKADIVCPVPDSGTAYAIGFSLASGIPFAEGLTKNRYAWRTFILPHQKYRDVGVKEKLNPIKSLISGKSIVLVDDSIVRGTTMGKIVQMLRNAGAKKVHVRIGSPPIVAPCFLGIDMKTREQFVATKKSVSKIANEIGADTLGYISIKNLVESIGLPYNSLCLGCLTGGYPVAVPGEKLRFQQELFE